LACVAFLLISMLLVRCRRQKRVQTQEQPIGEMSSAAPDSLRADVEFSSVRSDVAGEFLNKQISAGSSELRRPVSADATVRREPTTVQILSNYGSTTNSLARSEYDVVAPQPLNYENTDSVLSL